MVAQWKMDNSCNMEALEEQVECRAVEPDQYWSVLGGYGAPCFALVS